MENTLSTITQFNLTKTQIEDFAWKALDEIDSGMYNPLNIHLCLKVMEELVKKLKKGIAEQVFSEAEKYGRHFEYQGSRIQLSERKSYDYSADYKWNELSNEKRQREVMLKHLSEPVADPDSGEMLFPAPFKTTSVISISLPK